MAEITVSKPPIELASNSDFLGGGKLEDGIGLCLSGGGFRVMLFHLGAFVRLNELGVLPRLDRVASVSGGSIAAGALAVAWRDLNFNNDGVAENLHDLVAVPLLTISQRKVDTYAIIRGMLPFSNAANVAASIYDKLLFRGATLQDLPIRPRFSFTATSLQSGSLWRFAKEYAADWRVGRWDKPSLSVAMAVGASAAFPPYLSPAYVKLPADALIETSGADLLDASFSRTLCLTDGGIYDNLGLEPVWKRYRTIFVSDGGAATPGASAPKTNWLSQAMRVMDIALQQGINMRRRTLRGLHQSGARSVVYWGIGEGVDMYHGGNPLGFTKLETAGAAATPTRLTRYPGLVQNRILRAGYSQADAAFRASNLTYWLSRDADFRGLPVVPT
jgi:NTE family protein